MLNVPRSGRKLLNSMHDQWRYLCPRKTIIAGRIVSRLDEQYRGHRSRQQPVFQHGS